ncbi:MAG: endolytic transglycosylase MltG [Parcubacteria group bacterium]|nr:endolytic transglycosylase MltG [Parcubacteria group bacterium]
MKRDSLIKIITFILALGVVGVFYLFINAPSPTILPQPFSITKGESVASISYRLKQNDLIYSDILFRFYLKMANQTQNIKAGYYVIPSRADMKTIIKLITTNHVASNGIFLIKEGDTLKEIDNNLHQQNILSASQTITDLKIQDFQVEYPNLFHNIPVTNSLEGFLFPDSYHLPQGLTPQEIIAIFLNNFSEKTKDLNISYDKLILASILEKEVKTEEDKQKVADILERRLQENIPLQVDASICYAQNQSFNDCQLTKESFNLDSPYNTYQNRGLPPTPISNPGLVSIKASLKPLPNDYWYYLTNRKTSETIFSKTLEEHELARKKYL